MIKILDCTLRDGGYITKWEFGEKNIFKIVESLTQANLDFIEVGYLNSEIDDKDKSIYRTIEDASLIIPTDRKNATYLAMADVDQFKPENVEMRKDNYIDGIRVVFYKHQVEKALELCEKIKKSGYKLFVQPMVTIDYTIGEFNLLISKISQLKPYSIYVVDSFGFMNKSELKKYYELINSHIDKDVLIGFHSHNNMQLSLLNAESLFEFNDGRTIVIDSSLYGMGRGAGNLNTEIITNYYNENIIYKFDLDIIFMLISDIIYPIYNQKKWGYTPYYFLTALYKCHPNYAAYLLEEYDVSILDFKKFLLTIPNELRVKCRKPIVLEMYKKFINR